MPIGDDVLQPIPGPNPSGENLRYAAVYDKIKEARREDDDVPQGEWQIERKKADWALMLKLAVDALATKSKDLQVAVWVTEALVHREGFAGLRQGLDLLRHLLSSFWETLYPEIEDGEADLRAAPLEWVGSRLEDTLKSVPLTRNGLAWFKYKESRSVGYETDIGESEAKRQARETAVADGKTTAEEFDDAFKATPKAFYQQLAAEVNGCLTALEELKEVSDEKLHDLSPTYSNLRETLEVIRQAVGTLLQKKREQEPDEEPAAEPAAVTEEVVAVESGGGAAAAVARAPIRKRGLGTPPSSAEEAYEQVLALAQYLRAEQPGNPVPYMLVRALRWGELRAQTSLNVELFVPPSTEVRQQLKRLAGEGQWQELLEAAENAAGLSCGRGWLDVQRYVVQACRELGSDYEGVASAVLAALKSLLADFPDLPRMSLVDDTPVANAETQAWLEQVLPSARTSSGPVLSEVHMDEAAPGSDGEPESALPPDAYELAKQALQSRRADEAIEILTREIMQEHCARARFQRRMQLAQICMAAGYEALACPILEGLAEEIDQRKLEEWESPDLIAQSLSLLFRCWQKVDRDQERKDRLYARICRLDATQGLQLVH